MCICIDVHFKITTLISYIGHCIPQDMYICLCYLFIIAAASHEIEVTNQESLTNFTSLPSEAILTNLSTLLEPAGTALELKVNVSK